MGENGLMPKLKPHKCPRCDKETLMRYCSFVCGLDAMRDEYRELERKSFEEYPNVHKEIFG